MVGRTMTSVLHSPHTILWNGAPQCLRMLVTAALVLGVWIPASTGATLQTIKQRGYMIVATENDCPPFEYTSNTRFVGFDNDLLAILKKFAEFEIRQETLPWPDIRAGVAAGKYDVALTAAPVTREGAKELDFTMPIAEVTMTYVALKADTSIRSIADLSGKTLAVQQGAPLEVLADLRTELKKSGGKLGKVVTYRTYAEAYEDLVRRRVDAVINNRDSLSLLVRRTSDLLELGQPIGPRFAVAWAVRKGNRSLLEFLNAYLEQQYANGAMKQLQAKYNLTGAKTNQQ
jgi:polar amino acid transport system substrate-binding protein